jgi:hypothetical protein
MKTVKSLPILNDDIKSDIFNLGHEEFNEKYGVTISIELLEDIRNGLLEGDYPPTP